MIKKTGSGSRPPPKLEKKETPRPAPTPTPDSGTKNKVQKNKLQQNPSVASYGGASGFETRSAKGGGSTPPPPTPTPTAPPTSTPTSTPPANAQQPTPQAVPTPTPRPTPTVSPEQAAATQVDQAKATLDKAREDVKAADEKLKGQLARLGPAMTDAQKDAYVKAYHDKYKATYEAEATAARDLKTALENPALASNPAKLKAGYATLAESSEATAALEWANKSFTQGALKGDPALADIAGKAAATAAADIISEAGTPTEGVAKLEELLKPFMEAKELGNSIKGLKEAIDVAKEAAAGNYDRLASLADDWNGKSSLLKAVAVIGVAAGAASATNDLRQGNYAEAIGKLAQAGQGGLDLLAGVTKSLAQSGKLVELLGSNAAKAERLAGLASRFAPALGAVAASASLYQHATEKEKNAGTWLAIGGDLLSIAGSVLEATPLAPVGGIINAAGSVLTAAGDFISGIITRSARQQEEKDLMAAANKALAEQGKPTIPQEVINQVSDSNSRADRLKELGLSPQQIQQVIKSHPDLINIGGYFEAITDTARAAGVRPDKFNEFVNALNAKYGNELSAGDILNTIKTGELTQTYRQPDVDKALREYINAVMPEVANFR